MRYASHEHFVRIIAVDHATRRKHAGLVDRILQRLGYSCARRRTLPRVPGKPQNLPLMEAATLFLISLARPSPTL
jgi:hypothetical protein